MTDKHDRPVIDFVRKLGELGFVRALSNAGYEAGIFGWGKTQALGLALGGVLIGLLLVMVVKPQR